MSALFKDLNSKLGTDHSLNDEIPPDWPPVLMSEMKKLIGNCKPAKSPACDHILPEKLKTHINWWVLILATLFSYIIQSENILPGCEMAIIISIFRKRG